MSRELALAGSTALFEARLAHGVEARGGVPDEAGGVDAARRTAYPLIHVRAVVEINEVGNIVDPRPFHRRVVVPARNERFEHRLIGQYLGVARHARFGGRNAGKCTGLHRRVAVTAIETVALYVTRVTKRYGLRLRNVHLRHDRRPIRRRRHGHHEADECHAAHEAPPNQSVSARSKNLTHRDSLSIAQK